MSAVNRDVIADREFDTLSIFDHFWQDQSDINAIDTVTDSGTVAMGDAAGGTVILTPSDGSVADNDEAYLATPNESFKVATDKPLYGRFRFQFSEVASDKVNIAVGFQNAVGADSLIDDGGGPKVSGDTFAIGKKDGGGMYFYAFGYCNGTGTSSKSGKACAAATWYDGEIFVTPTGDGTTATVTYKIDGEYLNDFTTGVRIRHTVTAADVVLYDDWSPYETMTVVPYFAYFRRGKTMGMVEDLLDPQREVNKRRSGFPVP
jgi:hypothetical protein